MAWIVLNTLKVFLKKCKLIAHAFFEVIPDIDIEVADWIAFHLCVFPQIFGGFLSGAYWRCTVIIAYLEQDRATYVLCMFDRPVLVPPYYDASTCFVNIMLRYKFSITIINI